MKNIFLGFQDGHYLPSQRARAAAAALAAARKPSSFKASFFFFFLPPTSAAELQVPLWPWLFVSGERSCFAPSSLL